MVILAEIAGEILALTALGGSTIIVVVAIVYAAEVRKTRLREESRREIAAYIAEGSMSAEEGRKLMEAGDSLVSRVRDAIAGR